VVRGMVLGRRRRSLVPAPRFRLLLAVAVVGILLFTALAASVGASLASPSGSSPAPASPVLAGGPAPTISGFTASPSEVFVGSTTDLQVDASGGGVLHYAYSGLPGGCVSADSPLLSCTPTASGFFNVTVTVSETGAPSATASTSLNVDAVELGNFFGYNSSVATWANASAEDCQSLASPPFYQEFCDPEVQSPSLLTFSSGRVGVAYQKETTLTDNGCAAPGATVARVEYANSFTNGSHFGPTTDLGNDSCAFLNAIEPSFAVGGASQVYGAFVEENSTLAPWDFVARAGDGLGFVTSASAGATWSTPVSLDLAGNIARPSVAAVGSTVYVAFENIENSSATIGGGVHPISVDIVVSTDDGQTWTSPVTLPGLGASEDYTAASPSVVVSSSGKVSVAYATDRRCVSMQGPTCLEYADSIVVSSSTDNGTVWSAPATVASVAGESDCFSGACLPGYFQAVPEVGITAAPGTHDLYVAFAATYDQGLPGTQNYNHSGIFAAVSDNGGAWKTSGIDAPGGGAAERFFEPGIGATPSTVYVTFLESNETPGAFGFANSLSGFVQTLTVGATSGWTTPTSTDIQSFTAGGSVNNTRSSFAGYSASVAVTASGRPLIAFAMPLPLATSTAQGSTYYYVNTTTPAALVVGALVEPGDLRARTVVFNQTGIPNGAQWEFTIDGQVFYLRTPQIEFTNLPVNTPTMVGAYYLGGYWTIVSSYFNASLSSYSFNRTVHFRFDVWVGLEFNTYPAADGPSWNLDPYPGWVIQGIVLQSTPPVYVDAEWDLDGEETCIFTCTTTIYNVVNYYSAATSWSNFCYASICPWNTPWYFPLGSTVQLNISSWNYDGLTPDYWTGQGAGSYTGDMLGTCFEPGFECGMNSGNISIEGPINETLWLADAPVDLDANLTVSASGLPSGSVYHFDLNGAPYSAGAAQTVEFPSSPPGTYDITSVWASSPLSGYRYFGTVNDPDPFLSPEVTAINLTFSALVDMAVAPSNVSFEATDLLAGTPWSLAFNGTTYSSTTPWINVTTRPGTFPWSVGDAAAPSGTAGYVPPTEPTDLSVAANESVPISFLPAYLVQALSSPGGLVAIGAGQPQSSPSVWVADGTVETVTATLASGYTFVGWSGTGAGSYTGTNLTASVTANGPIVESAAFQPLPGARFNLTVEASGLPAGVEFTVAVGNNSYSSNTSAIVVGNLWAWTESSGAGHYRFSVPYAYLTGTNLTRFAPGAIPPVVGTNGTFTPAVVVPFSPQSLFQLDAVAGGIVESTVDGAPQGTATWVAPGTAVTISADADPGYVFTGWVGSGPGSYTGTDAQQVVIASGPVTEVAAFALQVVPPVPRYSLTFTLGTSLPNGTVWSVVVGGTGYSTNLSSLTIPDELAGTYAISVGSATAPGGLEQFRPTATDPAAYTVTGNHTLSVTFATYFWVHVAGSAGGSVTPGDAYYLANSILYLDATPAAGEAFTGWVGSGSGNYTGSNATASVLVNAPITEVASFESSRTATAAASVWSSPEVWLGIGAAALLVGLIVGVVIARMRAPPRGPSRTPPSPPEGGTGGAP
jgi:Divergent InlB B-repeat domain